MFLGSIDCQATLFFIKWKKCPNATPATPKLYLNPQLKQKKQKQKSRDAVWNGRDCKQAGPAPRLYYYKAVLSSQMQCAV